MTDAPRKAISRRRLVLLGIVSAAIGVVAAFLVPKPLPELSAEELIAEVKSGYVHEVVIVDKEVLTAVSSKRGAFRVDLRQAAPDLPARLEAMGVEVKHETTPLGLT